MTKITIPDGADEAAIETDDRPVIRKLEGFMKRYPKYVHSGGIDEHGIAGRWTVHRDMIGIIVPMWLAWDHV